MELSYQLASQSQGLGDLIVREILALNPDSLLGGKKTKAFAHFFSLFCFVDELCLKALANGFNICFNIYSILLNAVGRLLNDVERGMSKRFQHFIQQNLASGLVISFRSQLFSRLRHA